MGIVLTWVGVVAANCLAALLLPGSLGLLMSNQNGVLSVQCMEYFRVYFLHSVYEH